MPPFVIDIKRQGVGKHGSFYSDRAYNNNFLDYG